MLELLQEKALLCINNYNGHIGINNIFETISATPAASERVERASGKIA
jgi:hypothetical protein